MFIYIGDEAEGICVHGMAFRIDIGARKCGIEGSRCI
jgi:hypothetical protein